MALPFTFTNTGHPTIDADQFNSNFTYLDTGKNREAVVSGVAADQGSTSTPTTVTYSTPFTSATLVLRSVTFVNYSGSDLPVLAQKISNVTKNGFQILIGGGDPGTTVDVHYSAIGS